MLLKEYLTEINRIITDCAETGLIISSEVMTDIRTEKIGFVKGALVFLDESALFFKEYLDLRFHLDKKTYSFHYQDAQAQLRFRYDNAAHKPALGFHDHKHTPDETLPSTIPHLQDVLDEIVKIYFPECI
ncbi:MAG: hypothetical protein D3915_13035 [Candidatus Electrothrix sp. AU1_5]|nr:hypothetical protein [Candidatus Electrothrix gigas]MCI5226932.1 hypothetical protein [Candidatus Electrothrix gigas]